MGSLRIQQLFSLQGWRLSGSSVFAGIPKRVGSNEGMDLPERVRASRQRDVAIGDYSLLKSLLLQLAIPSYPPQCSGFPNERHAYTAFYFNMP